MAGWPTESQNERLAATGREGTVNRLFVAVIAASAHARIPDRDEAH
jgi:hypothetical protein